MEVLSSMFRQFLASPRPYFIAALILLIAAVASQFEVHVPSRSAGSVDDIVKLRERKDLNVVFVLIDTLRSDRLGIYGYPRDTSPTMDDLARFGIVFKRVLTQSSWTKTAMASLWTGTYPVNHGITRFNHAVPEEAVLPAEIFRDAGYRTAGAWRNGWVAPNFGFGQGFSTYVRPKPGRESQQIQKRNPAPYALVGTDHDLVRAASDFLDSYGRERFFLYLHAMDVHQYVYDSASAKFGTSYSDVYDQSIHWTDRLVAALVQKIDDLDLLTNTLIVITSDHGEAFQEHGTEGHAKNLYREVTQVPFIIALPFLLKPGIAVEKQIASVDIWPTLLDLMGLPPMQNTDGVSQLPAILAASGAAAPPDGDPRQVIFEQLDRRWGNPKSAPDPIVGVVEGDLRLFVRPTHEENRIRLYDHAQDPLEQHDVSAEHPEDVARLEKLANEYLAGGKSPWGVAPDEVELDAMKLEQLRALGYVVK